VNTDTPRIFIAATQQNAGKTTTALGLYSALHATFRRIGFIKPVGQRFLEIDGKKVDEDSVLIRSTFDTQTSIEDMSPIAVEPDFTRRYINRANHEGLSRRIQHAFDRAAWEKDFVIIEGTGHAGVGSVFDLSNARVAKLLQSKVVIVTEGGIGRPIDEIALNTALFDREEVEVVGVIMNKVLPDKLEYIGDFARRGLERLGLELIGIMPAEPILDDPTLEEVRLLVRGTFLCGESEKGTNAGEILIGAMTSSNLVERLRNRALVITPGDREDMVLAALSVAQCEREMVCGIVLSDGFLPHARVLELLREVDLPVIASPLDSYEIASRIESMTVKTQPGDLAKISRIQEMTAGGIQVDRLLEKLGC